MYTDKQNKQFGTIPTTHEEIIEKIISSNKKQYGQSILEYKPTDEDEDKNSVFKEDIMTQTEVENAREELKSKNNGSTIDKVSIDTLTGARASSKVNPFIDNKPSEIIDKKEKESKILNGYGMNLLTQILGSEPTTDEVENIVNYFRNNDDEDTIKNDELSNIEKALGERISHKLKNVIDTKISSRDSVIRKFILELYASYNYANKLTDDIDELSKLTEVINNISDSITDQDFTDGSYFDKLNALTNAMNRVNELDDRNKRLKNEYTLDDLDIHVIGSVRECLDNALSFKKIYNKINSNGKKYLKDMKDINSVYKTIEKWIDKIRSDSYTLFTFPVNDDLTIAQSRAGFLNYLYHAIIFNKFIDDDTLNITVDIDEYLDNELDVRIKERYYNIAVFIAYVMCKAFKYKNINNNDDRRILSYTLDIISKLNLAEYSKIYIDLVDYVERNFFIIGKKIG